MSSTYSNLKFEIIEVGGSNGTWGGITNTNIGTAIEQAIVGMATLDSGDFSSNVATLTASNSPSAQDFRAFCLNITATLTAAGTVNVPAIQKPYLVLNNSTGGYAVTVKVSGLTGVSIPSGKGCLVYNDGTDVGAAITYLSSLALGTALPVTSGGTGTTTSTGTGSVVLSNSPTLVTPALGTPSALVGTNITGTGSGFTAGAAVKLTTTNFTIEESGGALLFKYGATTIASLSSAGVLTTLGTVTGAGTP